MNNAYILHLFEITVILEKEKLKEIALSTIALLQLKYEFVFDLSDKWLLTVCIGKTWLEP